MSELCLQASLIQFTFDQKPERRPPQMARAATEWKLLAVVSGFAMLLWLAVIQFVRSDSFLPLSLALALSLFFSVSHSLSSNRSHRVTGGAEMHTWTSSLLISTAAIKDRPFFHSTPEGCELPAGPWLLLVFLNHFLFSSGCATSQSVSTARAASSPSSLDLLFCVVD